MPGHTILDIPQAEQELMLAQLLRAGLPSPVYHGEHGTRDLKELVRSYEYLVEDATRVMNRIKPSTASRAPALTSTRFECICLEL